MPVSSTPLESRKRKESAIVSRATLDGQRGAFERLMAFILLFVSFAGSVAVTSGGWNALLTTPTAGAIAMGVAIQIGLTAAEWWYGEGRGPWRYRLALSCDTAFTAAGYGPLIAPFLINYLAARGANDHASLVVWPAIVLVSAALAWWPEKTLID